MLEIILDYLKAKTPLHLLRGLIIILFIRIVDMAVNSYVRPIDFPYEGKMLLILAVVGTMGIVVLDVITAIIQSKLSKR